MRYFLVDKTVFDNNKVGMYGKLIYAILCKFLNADGTCFPSRKTISKCGNFSISTYNKYVSVMLLENERFIELNMQEKCGKLLISIENNYLNEPIFIDGIPISKEKDHGFGTQSIAYTVEKLHGNCQFSTHQHHFKLRVVI